MTSPSLATPTMNLHQAAALMNACFLTLAAVRAGIALGRACIGSSPENHWPVTHGHIGRRVAAACGHPQWVQWSHKGSHRQVRRMQVGLTKGDKTR
jgi:hypothetical protein